MRVAFLGEEWFPVLVPSKSMDGTPVDDINWINKSEIVDLDDATYERIKAVFNLFVVTQREIGAMIGEGSHLDGVDEE